MKKNTLTLLLVLLIVLLIGAVGYLSFSESRSNYKEAFIITEKVFSDYKGTKIVEEKFMKKQQKQKLELDSLLAVIQVSEKAVKNNLTELQKVKIQAKRNEYVRLLDEYESSNASEFQQAKQSLWIQINQYIKKYGNENDYTFIHGANGTGSLMYADTTYNITAPILEFINKEFEGK
jgi:outer membrane protein